MEPENRELVVAASFPHEFQANLVVNELESRGIPPAVSAISRPASAAEAPGEVKVLVFADELPHAQAVLDELGVGRAAE